MLDAADDVTVVVTSPRVAPGLLGADAWDVLRGSPGPVLAASGDPAVDVLRRAGVQVSAVDAAAVDAVRAAARACTWVGPAADEAAIRAAGLSGRTVVGSYDLPGARLLDLVAVMDRLRSPGGCPWDAEQTHRSLATYLVEETYETLEAIEAGDDADLREELGDLLLQVVFHSRIAEEHVSAAWSVDDVAAGIADKLVRRHPHVFADEHAPTAAHVAATWEQRKAVEKGRGSAVDGVPVALPALSLAAKLVTRAERHGVQVEVPDPGPDGELGDRLMALVLEAHRDGLDPEQALRDAARRFAQAVRSAEAVAPGQLSTGP